VSEAITKYSTLITISGHVDNPDDSDSKQRLEFEEEDNAYPEGQWGTIW
jgi:hypothetical protein